MGESITSTIDIIPILCNLLYTFVITSYIKSETLIINV